ncbi:hypothetical protein IFR05_005898 [Cadophora sp. M221]|nr:hypothetical protein IFR05_005898 [Cadophora sp. M221]
MLLTILSSILFINLSIEAPVIAERSDLKNDLTTSVLNMTSREIQYSDLGAIDVGGLCDTSFGKQGQCSFVTCTHRPTGNTLEDTFHAFYAFDNQCTLIGYNSAVNLKGYDGDDKFSFASKSKWFIDVRFSVKKEYG